MKIIFLDMDGVMNSDEFFSQDLPDQKQGSMGSLEFGSEQVDPNLVAQLDELIEASGASVVISSSWRHIWKWREIAKILKGKGLKNYRAIIGQTPESMSGFRGQEIRDWFDMHREERVLDPQQTETQAYVILDDNNDFDSEQQSHFVNTNPKVGLTPKDVQKALQILNQGI